MGLRTKYGIHYQHFSLILEEDKVTFRDSFRLCSLAERFKFQSTVYGIEWINCPFAETFMAQGLTLLVHSVLLPKILNRAYW